MIEINYAVMEEMFNNLDRTKDISVSTFRGNDEKGVAPRALYKKLGGIKAWQIKVLLLLLTLFQVEGKPLLQEHCKKL